MQIIVIKPCRPKNRYTQLAGVTEANHAQVVHVRKVFDRPTIKQYLVALKIDNNANAISVYYVEICKCESLCVMMMIHIRLTSDNRPIVHIAIAFFHLQD